MGAAASVTLRLRGLAGQHPPDITMTADKTIQDLNLKMKDQLSPPYGYEYVFFEGDAQLQPNAPLASLTLVDNVGELSFITVDWLSDLLPNRCFQTGFFGGQTLTFRHAGAVEFSHDDLLTFPHHPYEPHGRIESTGTWERTGQGLKVSLANGKFSHGIPTSVEALEGFSMQMELAIVTAGMRVAGVGEVLGPWGPYPWTGMTIAHEVPNMDRSMHFELQLARLDVCGWACQDMVVLKEPPNRTILYQDGYRRLVTESGR